MKYWNSIILSILAMSANLRAQNAGNHNVLFEVSEIHIAGVDYVVIPRNATATAQRTSVTMKYRNNDVPTDGSTELKWESGDKIDVYEADSKLTMPKTWSDTDQAEKVLGLEADLDATAGDTQTLQATYTNADGKTTPIAEREFTFLKIEIENTRPDTPVVLNDGDTLNVAKLIKVRPKFTPETSLPDTHYQWEIDGSEEPSIDVAIKTYGYGVETIPNPTNLVAADLQPPGGTGDGEISFYYTDEKDPTTLKVTITSDSISLEAEVDLKVEHVDDPNREIYASESPDADDNPDGSSGGVAKINTDHGDWHDTWDDGLVVLNGDLRADKFYSGKRFLEWHNDAILAHLAWRDLFNISGTQHEISAQVLVPRPSYLTEQGGNIRSDVYGYARIGECKDKEEVGQVGAWWHNKGHVIGGIGDMNAPLTSMKTANNEFWRWHRTVDTLRTFQPDTAIVTGTIPENDATIASADTPRYFVLTFDKAVSSGAKASTVNNFHENDIQITAASLTANGVVAKSVDTPDHLSFFFELPDLSPGTVNISLDGTRSFESDSWNIIISPE